MSLLPTVTWLNISLLPYQNHRHRRFRPARGTRLTSALTVHNVLLAEYPEALERLYRGYVFHRRGGEQPGDLPYTPYRVPVYSNIDGNVSARYVRTYVEAGEARAGRTLSYDWSRLTSNRN